MAVRSAARVGGVMLAALLTSGCMAVEANPLDVNSPRSQGNVSAVQQTVANFGDDPLNLAENGATLCYTQPDIGFQEFTVLVHNEALETFTLDDVTLQDPENLTLVSAEVSPANRDGHHKAPADDDGGAHGTHSAEPAPAAPSESAEPAGPVEPVSAEGYNITTHEYVNLVVAVSIAEGADAGTAQGITVAYSTGGSEFTGTHPLVVELDREGCV
ncbi:hypothetical protein [uncultured Arthrobacter sp.]|uniref:hypothetical protein n=1 Tax=uncultured Arthrobacter sp. TaxID=114050 RepID=UPI002607BC5E|nr:hypothetical protein [uncultured Arthrobacter sp.]